MQRILLIGTLVTLLATSPALADTTPSPWTHKPTYRAKVMGKIGYGFKNVLAGWTEPFHEVQYALELEDEFQTGLATGMGHMFWITFGGVLHLLTFPVTSIDFQLPHDGVFRY